MINDPEPKVTRSYPLKLKTMQDNFRSCLKFEGERHENASCFDVALPELNMFTWHERMSPQSQVLPVLDLRNEIIGEIKPWI